MVVAVFFSLNITQILVHIFDNYKHNPHCVVAGRLLAIVSIVLFFLLLYWSSLLFKIIKLHVRWWWFTKQNKLTVRRVNVTTLHKTHKSNTGLANNNNHNNHNQSAQSPTFSPDYNYYYDCPKNTKIVSLLELYYSGQNDNTKKKL